MTVAVRPPLGMLAELTHRCPLHCAYCSNPLELTTRDAEMSTNDWLSVLTQARDLGVLQVHLSGGEPLARRDLPHIVAHAHQLGCYTNLVTSGLGLTEARLGDLAEKGLDHVQLSVQDATATNADAIAGTRAHEHKRAAATLVNWLSLPLSVNVVLHRGNVDHLGEIIDFAVELGAQRLELAHTQYYGWALRNRDALLPTAGQLQTAAETVRQARQRVERDVEIVYVAADYYSQYPKPCNYGWGARQLTVAPDGTVLPCPAAGSIATLRLDNVAHKSLHDIWYSSASFNAYRGHDWMPDLCRECDRRDIDFGGCRCQAFALTGDAAATDPVCALSPHRELVDAVLRDDAPPPAPVMRSMP